jgi:hypothetical protein
VTRGEPVQLRLAPPERGWQALRVELEPDDFPADDARHAAVWIGPPPQVTAHPSAGEFVNAALASLIADGRAAPGRNVRIASADVVDALPALITPPSDPVRLGAANRALEKLGIPWRFASSEQGSAVARGTRVDGVVVTQRFRLRREGAGSGDTLASVSGEPWIVAGDRYVLVASRIDPAVTNFPVKATFVPWLADMLATRLDAPIGEVGTPIGARPGGKVALPAGIDAWENESGTRRSISGGETMAPGERGVWFLLRGARRVGALVVNSPPEESMLARTSGEALAAQFGPRARAASSPARWIGEAFAAGTKKPALTPLLIAALLLIGMEVFAVRVKGAQRSLSS